MQGMIDRLVGFFESIKYFFEVFGELINETRYFIPGFIQAALIMLFFFAAILFIGKLISGFAKLVEVIKLNLLKIGL